MPHKIPENNNIIQATRDKYGHVNKAICIKFSWRKYLYSKGNKASTAELKHIVMSSVNRIHTHLRSIDTQTKHKQPTLTVSASHVSLLIKVANKNKSYFMRKQYFLVIISTVRGQKHPFSLGVKHFEVRRAAAALVDSERRQGSRA